MDRLRIRMEILQWKESSCVGGAEGFSYLLTSVRRSPAHSATRLFSGRSCLNSCTLGEEGNPASYVLMGGGVGGLGVSWLAGRRSATGWLFPGACRDPRGAKGGGSPGSSYLPEMAPLCRAQSPVCPPVLTATGSPVRRWELSESEGAAGRCLPRGPWGAVRPVGPIAWAAAAPAERKEGAAARLGCGGGSPVPRPCRCSVYAVSVWTGGGGGRGRGRRGVPTRF